MLHKDFCGYATVIEAAFNYNSSQYQRGWNLIKIWYNDKVFIAMTNLCQRTCERHTQEVILPFQLNSFRPRRSYEILSISFLHPIVFRNMHGYMIFIHRTPKCWDLTKHIYRKWQCKIDLNSQIIMLQ
jgi:hypothetical protein